MHDRDVEIMQERIARLASQLAVIKVGAATDTVRAERLRRTEGALAATQAAVSEGIVAGGGTALLRAAAALDAIELEGDYARGVDVVRSVLDEPLYWIASNAGYDGHAAVDQVRAMPDGHGLDALTGEFGDLFESGVVDPVRVVAASIDARGVGGGTAADDRGAGRRGADRAARRDHRPRLRRPRGGPGTAVFTDLS